MGSDKRGHPLLLLLLLTDADILTKTLSACLQMPCNRHRTQVKCNRDGDASSCARCQRIGQPCVQRLTSTTFVVRADNGGPHLPSATAPPPAPLHASSSNSSTGSSSPSSAPGVSIANGVAGPMPPLLPPPMLSRPAGVALRAPSVGKAEMPLTNVAEELQLLTVVSRRSTVDRWTACVLSDRCQ